jgi:hypothetical protein
METVPGLLALPLLFGLPLAYGWQQLRVLRRWPGGWRLAAAMPLPGWGVWAGSFAHDVSRDPTSHNLFPFEILMCAAVAALYLGGLALLRRLARAPPG